MSICSIYKSVSCMRKKEKMELFCYYSTVQCTLSEQYIQYNHSLDGFLLDQMNRNTKV